MLLELAIHDFAIIDELRLGFEPGFNALTGETGAGKSILIDALGAVLGERVGADVVRTGAKVARIEATFDLASQMVRTDIAIALAELGIEPEDGLVILNREIQVGGRSTARINGRAATAAMLARLGALLVDIHGQSDHLSLLRPAEHLDLLDRYAGLLPARQEVSELVAEWRELRVRIADLLGNARQRARRVDLLRFQVAEIAKANPRAGEEEELAAQRSVLANTERLARDAATAHGLLVGSDDGVGDRDQPALTLLRRASGQLVDIATVDPTMQTLAERLTEVVYLVEDIAAETRDYRDRIEADPALLAVVEDRLAELTSLTRKYGPTVSDVIRFGEAAERELDEMTGAETDIESLETRAVGLAEAIGARASALSAARAAAGETLAREVETAIAELNMGRVRFAVQLTRVASDEGVPFTGSDGGVKRVAVESTGVDRVEFLIASNVGEALKPLGRVASGGETARLMLALKSILTAADATPTLVFDEIDVGVGGRSGQVVGEKLWHLSDEHQVLVITHLPQIAAFAETHFRIAKEERAGRVVSRVATISAEERIDELAAMLDGVPVTAAARASAREMLERVATWKRREAAGGRRQDEEMSTERAR